jgi:hypothetical protein
LRSRFGGDQCSGKPTINLGRDTVADCGAGSVEISVPENTTYTYSWTHNGNPVATTASYIASLTGTYVVTVTNQLCSGSDTVFVNIGQPAAVSFTGLDTLYCVYNNPVILFPNPAGGTFSGPGVSGNGFHPSVAGVGTFDVVYSYTDGGGCISTDTQSVRVDACLGVPENRWTNTISMIPNPSKGEFYIKSFSQTEKKVKLQMSDITGRIVLNETFIFNAGENSIPVNIILPGGLYLMKFNDNVSTSVFKMLMQ